MYLPTFWKLTAEATMYRVRHMSGYGVPVGFLGKNFPLLDLIFFYLSRLDHVPIPVQLGVLFNHPTPQRCPQESLIPQMRCPHGTNAVQGTNLQAFGQRLSSRVTEQPLLSVPQSREDIRLLWLRNSMPQRSI